MKSLHKKFFKMHCIIITFIMMLFTTTKSHGYTEATIIINGNTGEVLHSYNATKKIYPASLTKIMTLYITFEALKNGLLKLDQQLLISKNAASQPPTKLWLKEGETISVEEAINALIIKSSNDVAVVLAENISQTESKFAELMTKTAKGLGMKNTQFKDASGLTAENQSTTAEDLAMLSMAILQHFPEYYKYFSNKSFSYKGKTYYSYNRILTKYEGADGIKTGYIDESGFNLVASALKNGKRVIAIVIGSKSQYTRDEEMKDLLDYGFVRLNDSTEKTEYALWKSIKDERSDTYFADITNQTNKANNTDKATWGIQVGAYNTQDFAKNALKNAQTELKNITSDLKTSIEPTKTKSNTTVYRSRFYGIQNRSTAEKACSELQQSGMDCMIIRPDLLTTSIN